MPLFKGYKNPNWHKNCRKKKTRKNQQTFYKCNMCNNTIKITFYCITTTKKNAKGIKNIINVVDGLGLTNKYERKIQGQTKFRSIFVKLKNKTKKNIEFCDVTLPSLNGQKFKAHNIFLSASSIFFKKLLVNNLNDYSWRMKVTCYINLN